jgi:hypothetical protein
LFARYGGIIYSIGGDFFNLLTYSADLGPTAAEEAASVAAQLVPGINPALAPVPLPNAEGLFDPYGFTVSEQLPEVVVAGSRPATATAPAVLPNLAPVPYTIQPGGFPGLQPATGLATALSPATVIALGRQTATGTTPANIVLARSGLFGTGLGLRPGQSLTPGESPNAQPEEATQPTSVDCQATKTGQKNKKQQKKKKRSICYRGVYEERASGLLKFRKERIPCR